MPQPLSLSPVLAPPSYSLNAVKLDLDFLRRTLVIDPQEWKGSQVSSSPAASDLHMSSIETQIAYKRFTRGGKITVKIQKIIWKCAGYLSNFSLRCSNLLWFFSVRQRARSLKTVFPRFHYLLVCIFPLSCFFLPWQQPKFSSCIAARVPGLFLRGKYRHQETPTSWAPPKTQAGIQALHISRS